MKPVTTSIATPRRIEPSCTIEQDGEGVNGSCTRVGSRVELSWPRIGTFLVVAPLERARANISSASAYTHTHIHKRMLK